MSKTPLNTTSFIAQNWKMSALRSDDGDDDNADDDDHDHDDDEHADDMNAHVLFRMDVLSSMC